MFNNNNNKIYLRELKHLQLSGILIFIIIKTSWFMIMIIRKSSSYYGIMIHDKTTQGVKSENGLHGGSLLHRPVSRRGSRAPGGRQRCHHHHHYHHHHHHCYHRHSYQNPDCRFERVRRKVCTAGGRQTTQTFGEGLSSWSHLHDCDNYADGLSLDDEDKHDHDDLDDCADVVSILIKTILILYLKRTLEEGVNGKLGSLTPQPMVS